MHELPVRERLPINETSIVVGSKNLLFENICSPVAQSVERLAVNQHVRGSSPRWGARIQSGIVRASTKPTRNSGFFIVIYPITCYKVYQNPLVLGTQIQIAGTHKI